TAPIFSTVAIGANSSINESRQVTIPTGTAAGSYNAFVIVDNNNEVTQSNINNDFSAAIPFTVQTATVAPSPSSPSSGQMISTLPPQLTWSGGSNFNSLQINLSKSPFGAANIIYTSSSLSAGTTSITVPSGTLAAGTDYRWDVTACSGANLSGACVTS